MNALWSCLILMYCSFLVTIAIKKLYYEINVKIYSKFDF